MDRTSYLTVSAGHHVEIAPIKKSRFISVVSPVKSEEDVSKQLAALRSKYDDAGHHCWAYRLSDQRMGHSDDGEPSGSAGKPILSHIQGKFFADVCVCVVRYFGGTKLGVGGLVRAYGQAAQAVLGEADSFWIHPTLHAHFHCSYEQHARLSVLLNDDWLLIHEDFADGVSVTIEVPLKAKAHFEDALRKWSSGRLRPDWVEAAAK